MADCLKSASHIRECRDRRAARVLFAAAVLAGALCSRTSTSISAEAPPTTTVQGWNTGHTVYIREVTPHRLMPRSQYTVEELGPIPEQLKTTDSDETWVYSAEVADPDPATPPSAAESRIRNARVVLSCPKGIKAPDVTKMQIFVRNWEKAWINSDVLWSNCYLRNAFVDRSTDEPIIWLALSAAPLDSALTLTIRDWSGPGGRCELRAITRDMGYDSPHPVLVDRVEVIPPAAANGGVVVRVPLWRRLTNLPKPKSDGGPWNNQESFLADFVSVNKGGLQALAELGNLELYQYPEPQPPAPAFSRLVWRQTMQNGNTKYELSGAHVEIHPTVDLVLPAFDLGPAAGFALCAIPRGAETRTERWQFLRPVSLSEAPRGGIDPFPSTGANDALDLSQFAGIGLRPSAESCRGFAALRDSIGDGRSIRIDVAKHLRSTSIRVLNNVGGRAVRGATLEGSSRNALMTPDPDGASGLMRLWYWVADEAAKADPFFPASMCNIRAPGYRPLTNQDSLTIVMQPEEIQRRLSIEAAGTYVDKTPLPDRVTVHFPRANCISEDIVDPFTMAYRRGETVRALVGRRFEVKLDARADSMFEIVSIDSVDAGSSAALDLTWPTVPKDSYLAVSVRPRRVPAVIPYRIMTEVSPQTPPRVSSLPSARDSTMARQGQWPAAFPLEGEIVLDDLDATVRNLALSALAPVELEDVETKNLPVHFRGGKLVPMDPLWKLTFEKRKPGVLLLIEACQSLGPVWEELRRSIEGLLADGGRTCDKLMIGIAQEDQRSVFPTAGAFEALQGFRISTQAVPQSEESLKWAAEESRKIDRRYPQLRSRLVYVIPSEPVLYKLWLSKLPPFNPDEVEFSVIEVDFRESSSTKKMSGVAKSFVEAHHGNYRIVNDPEEFARALREFTNPD